MQITRNTNGMKGKLWYCDLELYIYSVQFSRSVVSDSLQPHGLQHTRPPYSSPTPRACSNSCPSVSDAIQPSHALSTPSTPAFNISQHQSFSVSQFFTQVTKVLEFQLQHQSFQWIFRTDFLKDWLFGSPCSPRDAQESSPKQFKSINYLALSFLYSPTLTSIYDYWKKYSID